MLQPPRSLARPSQCPSFRRRSPCPASSPLGPQSIRTRSPIRSTARASPRTTTRIRTHRRTLHVPTTAALREISLLEIRRPARPPAPRHSKSKAISTESPLDRAGAHPPSIRFSRPESASPVPPPVLSLRFPGVCGNRNGCRRHPRHPPTAPSRLAFLAERDRSVLGVQTSPPASGAPLLLVPWRPRSRRRVRPFAAHSTL